MAEQTTNDIDHLEEEVTDLHEKIDELTTLAEENNRMVKNLYQRARMATVVIFIKWFVIIGLTVGSLYFIQPYLEAVSGVYSGISNFGGFGNKTQDTQNTDGQEGKGALDNIKDLFNLIK